MIPTYSSNPTDQGSAEAAGSATTGPRHLASPSVAVTAPRLHCYDTGGYVAAAPWPQLP